MKNSLLGLVLWIVPKNLLSYFVGALVHLRLPQPLARWTVRAFARAYNLNMEEAEKSLEQYACVGDLFTRRLRSGQRPIGAGFIHPVDGLITTRGWIYEGRLIQAKGVKYKLSDLVKEPEAKLRSFEGGVFLTYYLCPTDYHRVHCPVEGEILECTHIPGRLWPVNPWSVSHISQLFAINERVVVWIKSGPHKIAVVFVGATNVGKIAMSFDPKIISNQGTWKSILRKSYRQPLTISKGDELGVFNMGSTVIVVTPKGYFQELPPGGPSPVKMGQSLWPYQSP